ncbi:MAG TPA: heme A synthase [Crocinitomix sp.]|nr:heme A synthase [Crocinitomix sp.]
MSKSFIKHAWITLVFIYLVVIAGSVVRSTGSGMGCPDWPKCFDSYIPPTSVNQLPENYKEIYANKRQHKVNKFSKLLIAIGLTKEANALLNDKNLLKEQSFNWKNTWTEYGNRLVGFIAGNLVLIQFIWLLLKFNQRRKLTLLALLNLILMGFEGWLGAIVVATNLVPWVLTLHMFFALIIIWIQIKIILMSKNKFFSFKISSSFKWLFYISILLSMFQIVMGSQVRQKIDFLMADHIDRHQWISEMDTDFYYHRSFFWVVLLINGILFWLNQKHNYGLKTLNYIVMLIVIEFITGILFSYAGMPAFIQPIHLLTATLLLGVQLYSLQYFNYKSDSSIRA